MVEIPTTYVQRYWERLLELQASMPKTQSAAQKCSTWLDWYKKWMGGWRTGGVSEYVTLGLALIHPDFNYDVAGDELSAFQQGPMLVSAVEKKGKCQIQKLLPDLHCHFQNSQLEGDHYWPLSLGGPSNTPSERSRNRILLCSYHNQSKSNSILLFAWDPIPHWLEGQLIAIASDKRSQAV